MKKLKSKGFSMIELLAAIVVVGLLAVISISAVTRYINKTRQQKVVQNKKNVAMAAELYLQANRDLMPKMVGEIKYIPVMDLRNTNYIKEDVTNDKGEDCMEESFVRVFKLAEGDYNYTTYLYCGDEKAPDQIEPPKPYLVDYNDNGRSVKVLFSKEQDVKKANFSFKLRGSQNDETIGIYSYSYSILARTDTNENYTEVYNSGTLEANKHSVVEFKSRPISSYVDLPGVTSVLVKITALNEQGGFLSYETDYMAAAGAAQYEDNVKPLCPALDDESGRQGEPSNMNSWLNKNDIGSAKYPRVITLKCDDGDGSGCKRDTFTESWPNENKNPVGIMFGTITLEDNSVVDSQGRIKDPNREECSVAVLVDLQAPSVGIDIINPKNKQGVRENAAQSISYAGNTYTSTTIPVRDKDYAVKGNLDDTTLTIYSTNYKNAFSEYDASQGWLNKEYYPEGVQLNFNISDNIYLYKYTWEVNQPYLNLDSSNYKDISVDNPGGIIWERNSDPNYAVDENYLYNNRETIPDSKNTINLTINLKDEGARYGVLTVYDRAGNITVITVYANLDRTIPKIDEGNYPVRDYAYVEIPPDLKDPYETTDDPDDPGTTGGNTNPGETGDTTIIWEDDMTGQNLCDNPAYNVPRYDSDDDIPEDITTNYCHPDSEYGDAPTSCESSKMGYGSLQGYDEGVVERAQETGCYKIGVSQGNNGIEPRDYLSDYGFSQLEEYQTGTWSNEEIICGPVADMMKDNRYTQELGEGQKEIKELDHEISGWVAVHMVLYKEKSLAKSRDARYNSWNRTFQGALIPQYSEDENDTEYVKKYVITSLDRSTYPVIKDQGTHRLKWKNCDRAGNCSEYQLTENIKIDTIKPHCQTAVYYNDAPNSDTTQYSLKTGPNHNGWLYDEQTATVYNNCADSSHLENNDYFKAMNSLRDVVENFEVGSGCRTTSPTTDSYTYETDINTCSAGPYGNETLGRVEDLAGNVGYCETGATVRKDTTPPTCGTEARYYGVNGEDENQYKYNVPNRNGWAIAGMTISLGKVCNDSINAKTSVYNGEKAFSGCTRADDRNNGIYNSRFPSTYNGTAPVNYSGMFTPTNGTIFDIEEDKDIYAYMGTERQYNYETHQYDYKGGYVVDRAGNVSLKECSLELVKKDTNPPLCSNSSELMNSTTGEFHIGEYGDIWAGGSGDDGHEEYVKVFKTCRDDPMPNAAGGDPVTSGCEEIDFDDPENFWLYGNVQDPGTDRISPGERRGEGATFDGPNVVADASKVRDRAGNKGVGDCGQIDVNIDYTPPSCAAIVNEEQRTGTSALVNRIEYNEQLGRYIGTLVDNDNVYDPTYYGNWTGFQVNAIAYCMEDNPEGSGCDVDVSARGQSVKRKEYNPETNEVEEVSYESRHPYNYLGANKDEYIKLYTSDLAKNMCECETSFHIKQDTNFPEAKCYFSGSYSRDDQPDSFITIRIEGLKDPLGEPDNLAIGLLYSQTDTTLLEKELELSHIYQGMIRNTTNGIIKSRYNDGTTFSSSSLYSQATHSSYSINNFPAYDNKINFTINDFASHVTLLTLDISDLEQVTKYKFFTNPVDIEDREHNLHQKIAIEPGQTTVTQPLYCGKFAQDYYAYLHLVDQLGNEIAIKCDGEPIHVPGCCDEVISEDVCEDWEWTTCTRNCQRSGIVGKQYESRICTNYGYYNNGKACSHEFKRNENTDCNLENCCASQYVKGHTYPCETPFKSNPCSYGTQTTLYQSVLDHSDCHDEDLEYEYPRTSLCQVDKEKCDELAVSPVDEPFGHITPTNNSCSIYAFAWTQRNDYVEFRPTDPENCKIDAAVGSCITYRSSKTSLRSNITKSFSRYSFTDPCQIDVTWSSEKYDFEGENKVLKNQSYIAVKCEVGWKNRYYYCMDSCNSNTCIEGPKIDPNKN